MKLLSQHITIKILNNNKDSNRGHKILNTRNSKKGMEISRGKAWEIFLQKF